MQSSSTRSGGIGVFNDDIVEESKFVAVADDRVYNRVPESIAGANVIGNEEDFNGPFADMTVEVNNTDPRASLSPASKGKKKKKMSTRRDHRNNNLVIQA